MLKKLMVAGAMALAGTAAADAKTLRFAFQGQLAALDPYTLNETFTLGMLGNVYEGLTKRDKDLKIIPGLAEKWEQAEPTRWRFYLRKDVKYANGNAFNADDVVFSAKRIQSSGSQLTTRFPSDAEFVKVDDYTVDVKLKTPNPILVAEWDTWYIMDKEWAEAEGATNVVSSKDATFAAWAFKANGTGPFIIESHQPGVKTVFKPNPNWRGPVEHNLTEVVFTPIASDATRVAALLSGEIDLMDPVPVQDVQRVNSNANTKVLSGPELRVIHFFFDQKRDELTYSNVKGKNPFKDVRVRKAFYQAIDMEAIRTRVMRNMATPVPLLIASSLFPRSGEFKRLPYDPEAAKKLLAEAGYPNGFELTMHCSNDRYVADEAICQATVSMLARIGVKVTLQAEPKTKYFARVNSPSFDASFGILGWTPGSFDSWNVLFNLAGCRDDKGVGGPFNLGGYCSKEADELNRKALTEPDLKKRDDQLAQAFKIITDEVSHIPLHQQALAWGARKNLEIVQRADNQVLFYWAKLN